MRIEICGESKITYHKYVEMSEDDFHALVVRARNGKTYEILRDYVDPSTDVLDEEANDYNWTIIGPDGTDALDG